MSWFFCDADGRDDEDDTALHTGRLEYEDHGTDIREKTVDDADYWPRYWEIDDAGWPVAAELIQRRVLDELQELAGHLLQRRISDGKRSG